MDNQLWVLATDRLPSGVGLIVEIKRGGRILLGARIVRRRGGVIGESLIVNAVMRGTVGRILALVSHWYVGIGGDLGKEMELEGLGMERWGKGEDGKKGRGRLGSGRGG
jgi:hypothetical protein